MRVRVGVRGEVHAPQMDCVASALPYWQLGIAHCNSQTKPSAMHTLKMLLPNACK